jgi:hypothetical protein
LKAALKINITIKHYIRAREKTTDVYNLSGVYQMICKDFPLKYVGQMGRTFRARCNEHIREIQTNIKTSKYAQHILHMTHNCDITEKTMKNIACRKERANVGYIRKLLYIYIYIITKQGLQINEISSGYNPIYEFLTKTKSNIHNATHSRIPYPPPLPLISSLIKPTPPP